MLRMLVILFAQLALQRTMICSSCLFRPGLLLDSSLLLLIAIFRSATNMLFLRLVMVCHFVSGLLVT